MADEELEFVAFQREEAFKRSIPKKMLPLSESYSGLEIRFSRLRESKKRLSSMKRQHQHHHHKE